MPSELETVNRRNFLSLAATGATGIVAGCASVPWSSQDWSPPDRRVPADWHPNPGQWPLETYNYARTGHNPFASPPRSRPETAWTYNPEGDTIQSLIIADESVYIRTNSRLAAISLNGELQWEQSRSTAGSLRFIAGRLYEAEETSLTALHPDGAEEWSTNFEGGRYQVLERDGWVFAAFPDHVLQFHADTGKQVGKYDIEVSTPVTSGGRVYVGRNTLTAYALNNRDFEKRWSVTPEKPYARYGFPTIASGLIYRPERALAGADVQTGRVSIYNTEDGEKFGELGLAETPHRPTTDGDAVYVSTATVTSGSIGADGRLVALSLTGGVKWKYTPGASLRTPILADGTVYVAPFANQEAPLAAFDASTGEKLWSRPVGKVTSTAVANDTLYVSSQNEIQALKE